MALPEALLLQVSADVRGLQKQFQKAAGIVDADSRRMERRVEGAARHVERTLGGVKLPNSLRREFNQLGEEIGTGLRNASSVAQVALLGVTAAAIKLATEAQDINSAFAETFGAMEKDAQRAADKIASSMKRSVTDVKKEMNTLQQVLKGLGLDAETALKASEQLAARSIDLASNKGISDARAAQAILSGLTGETEPLKNLGIVLNEAAVKAELLRLGFKGNASAAPEAAKAMARLNLILEKTAFAAGDVARTSDQANNKLKEAQSAAKDAAIDLGTQLLPAFVKVAEATTAVLKGFNALPGGLQIAGLAMLAFIAAGGPIAGLLTNLKRVIDLANETRKALAAVAGASAAAGAAGGAGAAAGAVAGRAAGIVGGTGVGLIALGAGSVIADPGPRQYRKTVAAVNQATDEALSAAVNRARADLNRIASSNPGAGANDLKAKLNRDIAALTAEQMRRATGARRTSGATTPGAAGVVGGFGLPAGLRAGSGGSGGGGGRTGSRRRTSLDPVDLVTIDKDTIYDSRALEERDLLKPFDDRDLILTQDAMQDLADTFDRIREETVEFSDILSGAMTRGFEDLSDAIATAIVYGDDLGDMLLNIFRSVSQQIISQSIQGAIGGGGGFLNFLKTGLSFASSAFGGPAGGATGSIKNISQAKLPGYAAGTNFAPGGLSMVGERGAELINLPRGAQVIPNDVLRGLSRAGQGGVNRSFSQTLNLTIAAAPGMTSAEARRTGQQAASAAMRELATARRKGIA
jgi:hypothetical protein